MKTYIKLIKYSQEILIITSIAILMILPILIVFHQDIISNTVMQKLYDVLHISVFFVMMIRPLADIFTRNKWIRPLVILRKGAGIISASIIVSFILAKLMVNPMGYIYSIGTREYWSLANYALFAHLADLSAIILLITSNNLSKRIFGGLWKNIQKLSYVYFYGGVLYVYLAYRGIYMLLSLVLVTAVTIIAYFINKNKLSQRTL